MVTRRTCQWPREIGSLLRNLLSELEPSLWLLSAQQEILPSPIPLTGSRLFPEGTTPRTGVLGTRVAPNTGCDDPGRSHAPLPTQRNHTSVVSPPSCCPFVCIYSNLCGLSFYCPSISPGFCYVPLYFRLEGESSGRGG